MSKIQAVIGLILLTPYFAFMVSWAIHDILDEIKRGDWRHLILPFVFVSALVGAFVLGIR